MSTQTVVEEEFKLKNEEKKFVRKLDIYLLTWGVVLYILKNVDQANYKNAYVSGMKEDLNMSGSDYNWLSTYYTIGYAIAAIPCQILMTRVKASYFMGGCELVYGIYKVNYLFGLRFLIGFFESCSWSGITFVLFNYYNPQELSFRGGLIMVATQCGRAFTGFMQAAIYTNLEGSQGIPGWRWLFIINGAITVVIALSGFFLIPDTPDNGGAKWMTPGEISIAKSRVEKLGRRTVRKFEWKKYFKPFLDYRFYIITLAYSGWDLGSSATSYITLWLKAMKNSDGTPKYSVQQVDLIPGAGYLLAALSIIIVTRFADLTQKRIHSLVFQQICGVIGCSILSAWPKSNGAKFAGFFIMYTVQSTGPIITSFIPEIWRLDNEVRSTIIVMIVIFTHVMNAWLPLVVFPTDQAPHYKAGYEVMLAFNAMSLIGCVLFHFFVYKKFKQEEDSIEFEK
ncbi:putative pantothenate transporter [Hyphopichia burtonii NRRL Y-1933]|uniref:Putative pantothenate transporter n=1 Tax=Hyphopichia burtonii NRRL Y-1933 TaxID=984485 RepID=A0A1E4RMH3_9ASCO|nr:putative pantothenate transporter [Hyphopichia burtonii NRRL Y-1933]ODV68295.1 putative pantothenate transporter [Hyphopichia burtonii NRRL Y-1933]